MAPRLLLLACAAQIWACNAAAATVRSLGGSTKAAGGSPWTLRNHNGSLSLPATVPGVVHLDLLRAKKIAEPYCGYGELELAWVYREPSWTFSRTISAFALGHAPGRVLLRSEGLDTIATVTLNGKLVGKSNNMFHRHLWDITSAFLPAATNTLEIRFDSPALASSQIRKDYPYAVSGAFITPLQYPSCDCPDPAACFSENKGCGCLVKCKQHGNFQTTRNFLRKSQAHWGWDWGAGFLTSGIYRELSLVSYEHSSVIRDVIVQIFPIRDDASAAAGEGGENPTSAVHLPPTSFRVDLDVFLTSDATQHTTVSAALPSLGAENATVAAVAPGETKVRISLQLTDVPNAALWYPNGYGEAVLHTLNVTVGRAGGDASSASRWEKRVGLKSVELVQEPLPRGLPCGRSDCGGGSTCSDISTGGGYTCAFQSKNGKCNQSLTPWHVPLGQCCSTCFNCSAECLAANGETLQPGGLSMVFRVNGIPVFIKGANWIATDQFEPRIPQRKGASKGGEYQSAGVGYDALLGAAKTAHYNMLRVWGGGIYERDDFYNVADELGIMIWEEGKFACSLYPRDKEFLKSVATEVDDQIRRLSHHASIAVYSGNNENMQPGMASDATVIDYSALYDDTLQVAVRAADSSRPYWAASPSNGNTVDDPEQGLFIQRWGDENDARYGDAHIYPQFGRSMPGEPDRAQIVDCEDLSRFGSARFVSEYGFISMESWASMESVTAPDRSDLTADGNSSQLFFRMRQDWPRGQQVLLGQLGLHYHMPNNKDDGLEAYKDLTYLSQAVHAHCLTLSSAHYRMQRGSAAGTMGLMFWSLNNQWQGQSDAAVDYTGRWKLLQHATARYFAPMLLHLHSGWDTTPNTGWNDTNITAGIINDTPHTGVATVTMTLRSWATGDPLHAWHSTGTLPAYSSHNFTKARKAELLGNHTAASVFLIASATLDTPKNEEERSEEEAVALPQAHHYFTKMKVAELHDPKITLVFGGVFGENLTVTVACKAPAPHVFLDPGVLLGHFDDNGILLLPSTSRTLIFDTMGENVTVETLKKNVVARSPWSTQHPQSKK